MSNSKPSPAGEPQNDSTQHRPDSDNVADSTSGQGAASAYARFRSQLEQRAHDGLQDSGEGRNR